MRIKYTNYKKPYLMENELSTNSKSSKENKYNRLINFSFYLSIILFFIAFNFNDTPPFGWYQQFLPNIGSHTISDVFFLDSLNGWAVTPYIGQNDTAFVLKTTNGGNNWIKVNIRSGQYVGYNKVKFLNSLTGFVCGTSQSSGYKGLSKSTDGGFNWVSLNVPDSYLEYADMSILNVDTIWLVASDSFSGGVFLTTNGGLSWTQQFSAGSQNPNEIYMFNSRIGFIGGNPSPRIIWKTSNGGNNWFTVDSNDYLADMYFIDSLMGWKCSVFGMKKTTNGGLNWITQQIPSGGNIIITGVKSFSNINRDTIWGSGGSVSYPGNQIRGILYRTINNGDNWYYQIPDTSIHIGQYSYINFVNKLNGWGNSNVGQIHTVTGGDTTFLTSIRQISSEVPKDYKLFQNFPNPFNPITNVKVQMLKQGLAEIKVFDITGKLIKVLLKKNLSAREYNASFNAGELTSGVYFYSLFVNGVRIDTKKAVLLK